MSLFGRNTDNQMAESERLEWEIENSYVELQMKRLRYEQAVEEQRRKDKAEYDAEQKMYADRNKRYEKERLERKAVVKKRGNGQWLLQTDGTYWDFEGNIVYPSDLR